MASKLFLAAFLLGLSIDGSLQQQLSKILVATGRKGALTSVEIINLDASKPDLICDNLPDLPNGLKGPTGQFFNKSIPVICGGIPLGDKDLCECFAFVRDQGILEEIDGNATLPSGEWVTHTSPTSCGTHSKSVSLTAGENKENLEKNDLWLLTGGLAGGVTPVNRVETFDGQSWKSNAVKSLPIPVYLHCLVRLNDTILFSIGGTTPVDSASGATYAYDNDDNTWTRGPTLNEPRSGHACGILKTVNENGEIEKTIVVAGGSTGSNYAKTVEILRVNKIGQIAEQWETAKFPLPRSVLFGSMVEYDGSVILVGGGGAPIEETSSIDAVSFDGDALYQLKSADGEWVELPQKLKEKRSQATAFLVSDEIAGCS